ncbi:polyribonucleotide nucleotidyltransferase [Pseudoleptotrichia goodfellowii]|uniref:Polyribonucleotide nucleotidyltransferase n=1 Tax=Pseudoleptotrichia goodfellowii F0264 TaxID=596323 RepID=D0GNU9_9FUSO|nr:polyribonucleotide nucleotidyltransferase [Pseudoleptotrichia goodfellowii]EEY34280.1 polyribonucleotide nucleotidyltransferase [Pseudoleptotrichia goodfellowii F0264]
MFDERTYGFNLGTQQVKLSTGKIARQAGGSVMVQCGGTVLLVTATRSKDVKEGQDFFPLTVDYIEKFYASGKFPGGFVKRESRPSTDEILISRLVDRPIRPLFPEGFLNSVHIVITVVSYDEINQPENLATIGVSVALGLSDIPFAGTVAGVTVGYVDGEYVLNPTAEQLEKSEIHLSVAGTKDAVTMVEAGAKEVSEEVMLEAIMFGHERIKEICAEQDKFLSQFDVKKYEFEKKEVAPEIKEFIDSFEKNVEEAVMTPGKLEKYEAIDNLEIELFEKYVAKLESEAKEIDENLEKEFKNYYREIEKKVVRDAILYKKYRADGRTTTEIRPLDVEVDTLPVPHGSALFTRGETQALVTVTLGSKADEQIVDGIEDESRKKFFLHYNFPPYSVGEAGFLRAPGRRELGHGNLAERALKYVMPDQETFPYTVRLVSEITESNGSSSQASICGGSLALMAAGVPIKSTVAGIAMGLIKEGDTFTVLTDIQGLEDHLGDMDFKVAGTKKGITAIQMDIKIEGITREIMDIALKQALEGRYFIIDKMEEVISEPRPEIAENAPKIELMKIDPSKIAGLIGPAGKVIKAIIEETGVSIDIEDDGSVSIFGKDPEMMKKAIELVKRQTQSVELNGIYDGKVTKLMKFGAFVEVLPGKEGLLHISEISHKRVAKVEDVLKEGQEIKVKVITMEDENKFNLSMKALISKEEGVKDESAQ